MLMRLPEVIGPPEMPDFRVIEDINERKAAFFGFLLPMVTEANREIEQERRRLERLAQRAQHGRMGRQERFWLQGLASRYGMALPEENPDAAFFDELLKRVDIIPPSLALAQAALESGWGTSRFARLGNNLFGVWCYTPGCGIVPQRRPPGATHEVKRYASPAESFADYMRNLNSNVAYARLRELRATQRANGEPVTGRVLADGLYRYSSEGWTYVGKVKNVIQSNRLHEYDLR